MSFAKAGSITVNYNPDSVDTSIARDVVDTFNHVSLYYPNDIFFNLACPSLNFDLMKRNDEIGYQITFYDYNSLADTYLQFIKRVYKELQKKYKISIIFLGTKGNITFEYSKKNYWKALFKNNIIPILLIPPTVVFTLWLGNLILSWLSSVIKNEFVLNWVCEMLPLLIGYPVTIIAFKSMPLIPITKIINFVVVIISVFAYYFFTGNGLIGSCILMAICILQSIQNTLTD